MTAPLRLPPGFHADVPAAAYHADPAQEPSLSSSLARVLVSQTPRLAFMGHPRLNQDFTPEVNEKFDIGNAVHDALSSGGTRIATILGFDDWRSKVAKQERDEARAAGMTPLLAHQAENVMTIVSRVAQQLSAAKIDLGHQESVLVAQDRGVWLRAMVDALNLPNLWDFKVSKLNLANDVALGRHIVDLGYDLRAYHYLRVTELVFPEWAGRLKFSWIFVEENEPHGIRVVEADATFLEFGRRKFEFAIRLWEQCLRTGVWPHLEGLPKTVPYPNFKENEWLERESGDPAFITGPLAKLRELESFG